jgi:hypothetical protein
MERFTHGVFFAGDELLCSESYLWRSFVDQFRLLYLYFLCSRYEAQRFVSARNGRNCDYVEDEDEQCERSCVGYRGAW